MSLKRACKAFCLGLLSIILTAVTHGAENRVSREAYVTAAFEEFHSLLYFLSGSEPFLQNLTPEERQQFLQIGESVVRHVVRLGHPSQPGQDRTSTRVDFKLRFSDRQEDFILSPGEPPRTAKMAGDIWFNLNVINNPKISFGMLDAFQIMFHEFGHKIVENKKQELIDSVAAKMRLHLTSYYKESFLNSSLKVSSLVLPYISVFRQPVDFQFEPVFIVEHQGRSALGRLFLTAQSLRSGVGFYENPISQAYARSTFTPKFSLKNGDLEMTWQIATRHSFVVAEKYNYMNLYTNIEKAKVDEKMEPILETQRLLQIISADELERIAKGVQLDGPIKVTDINIEHLPYAPVGEKTRWLEKLQLTSQEKGRMVYSAIIQTEKTPKTALLLGTLNSMFYKFSGQIEPLTQNIFRLSFSLPAESSRTDVLELYSVALDGKERIDLEDVVRLQLTKKVEPRSVRPNHIGFKGMKDQWLMVNEVKEASVGTDEIVWRFGFKDSGVKIEQIEIMWLVSENIIKGEGHYGARARPLFEVIGADQIRQEIIEGVRVVEIRSKEGSKLLLPTTNSEGYKTEDSFDRIMRQLQIMDVNYNTYATRNISLPTGWSSAFKLSPQKKHSIVRCENIFQ